MKASSASMERVVLVKPQNTTVRPTRSLYTASRSAATPRHSVQAGSRITCASGPGLGASKNICNEQQDQGKQQVQENQNAVTAAGIAQHASVGAVGYWSYWTMQLIAEHVRALQQQVTTSSHVLVVLAECLQGHEWLQGSPSAAFAGRCEGAARQAGPWDLGHGGVEQLDERHPGHHLAPIPGQIIAFIKSH